MIGKEYKWYVVYVTRNHEKKSLSFVQDIGVEALLPINYATRRWSDRIKRIEEPMFPSYLFVRSSCVEYFDILKSPSILRYVSFKGEAAIVPDWQIAALKEISERNYYAEVTRDSFIIGESVIVTRGPMCGTRGELISDGGNSKTIRLVIEAIGYSVLVSIPEDHLMRIPSRIISVS